MVEGASALPLHFPRKSFVDAHAPPTALRAVPIPACAGAIPKGSMTEEQMIVIEGIRDWARTLENPVDIVITEF
jgi:hypothetical protein